MNEEKYTFTDYCVVTAGFTIFCILQVVFAHYILKCDWDPLWIIYTPVIGGFFVVALFSWAYDAINENSGKTADKMKLKKKVKR